jgi:zinc metalloprotease ZmpB
MSFVEKPEVEVRRDEAGVVRTIQQATAPFLATATLEAAAGDAATPVAEPTPRELATQYLQVTSPAFGFTDDLLANAGESLQPTNALSGEGSRLRIATEKSIMDTTVVSFAETHRGLEIWEAGASVVVLENPRRVVSSQNSVQYEIELAPDDLDGPYGPDRLDLDTLAALLNAQPTRINGLRALIYRYDPDKRFDPESSQPKEGLLQEGPPTLPLPAIPGDIQPGIFYVVTEALFSLALPNWGELNWRAFIETRTGAVLYLRAFVAGATGKVFAADPITLTGDFSLTPDAPAALLDPLRASVDLPGLVASDPQELAGEFGGLAETDLPASPPPISPAPGTFDFDVVSDEFSAVNAYYHCDALFRMVKELGFDLSNYFDGTTFPVPVDFRGFGDAINARAPGNVSGTGSGGFQFGRASSSQSVGIAADWRVVLHEFGHALLWDSVHSPNFGFAHSAGDSLAAILSDPDSRIWTQPTFSPDDPKRFFTFPWLSHVIDRRHDRKVEDGWGWGGPNDVGGYASEQILSTTMFRIYRAVGGDSPDLDKRREASRYVVYLIIRGIGTLATAPVTPTPAPDDFVTALINADVGSANFEGQPGGAYTKVIRWGFEKQDLFGGNPPVVDVYIDDGRNGEYQYLEDFSHTTDIWNRLAADGGLDHQEPTAGTTNFAYVRVKNRGQEPAANVVVNGYQSGPGSDLVWPAGWQPLTTAQSPAPGPVAPGGEVIVGPFEWTPQGGGDESLLMAATTASDRSNIDPATFFPCATGPTRHDRLIPFDNNLAQRTLTAT